MGTTFFTCGMLVMYACSTLYHWWMPGSRKRLWRIFDHISIYVMIAASYTPICIGVVGGALGWTVFGHPKAVRTQFKKIRPSLGVISPTVI